MENKEYYRKLFPLLADYELKPNSESKDFNCISHTIGLKDENAWPDGDGYWPVSNEKTKEAFDEFYEYHGFGSFQDNEYLSILDINFIEKWKYTDKHVELLNYILNDVGVTNIYLHQRYEEDFNFYLKFGFQLYKDYGQFFSPGRDLMI